MSILSAKNYLIAADFVVQSDEGFEYKPTYIGNFEELRRAITATYSKIPHDVKIVDNVVYVLRRDSQDVLTSFTFSEFASQKIPDHF